MTRKAWNHGLNAMLLLCCLPLCRCGGGGDAAGEDARVTETVDQGSLDDGGVQETEDGGVDDAGPGDARSDDGGPGDPPPESGDVEEEGEDIPVPNEFTLPGGAYADISVWEGDVWIFAENEARSGVYFYRNYELVESVTDASWPYALYVRGCAYPGGGAAAFQGGDYPAAHWGGATYTWTEDGTVFGVEVAAIAWTGSEFIVAYMVTGKLVKRWIQLDGSTTRREEILTPTTQGINRVMPDGTVTLVDDTRTDPRYPLLYRPWEADGHVAVGECTDDPPRALGYHDGALFLLFDGLAFRPRAVVVPAGYVALCVGETAIRVTTLPPFNYL